MEEFKNNLSVALAHDTLVQYGGAERVLEQLHELFPHAPVFTLVYDKDQDVVYKNWDIRTSWLQIFYTFFSKLQYYILIIPLAVRSLRFEDYNLVVSSSSSFIKNVTIPKKTVHICYCHTPTRFLWHNTDYAAQELPVVLKPFEPILQFFLNLLRKWDYSGAQRVSHFVANSKEVQRRIKQYYNRDSTVIYPGVDTKFWNIQEGRGKREEGAEKKDYFLLAGRLQAHKKNDLLVEIFNELGLPLHVVGIGRQEKYLRSIAKPNIQFFGRLTDEELRDQYSGAIGFIYPQIEDFGLGPLEAAACGTASIGIATGGSLETIVPGVTGELFANYDKEKIKQVILSWNWQKYSIAALQAHAEQFSKEKFRENILTYIHAHA